MSIKSLDIAFIGFGEVGQRFSKDLGNPSLRLRAYDILFDDGEGQGAELLARAKALNVGACVTAAEASKGAHIIFSAVTADAAESVARHAAGFIGGEQIFLDINSASPETKRRAAQVVTEMGGAYVEGAVMAPVLQPGIRVPILAGGPHAERAATLLNKLGMNITPVANDYGKASAIKLCRSIMIKGIEALIVDCAAACKAWDVSDEVFASLNSSFPSIDWSGLADTMGERVAKHGIRRAAEMRETADMLAALDIDPSLVRAVAEAQRLGALRGMR